MRELISFSALESDLSLILLPLTSSYLGQIHSLGLSFSYIFFLINDKTSSSQSYREAKQGDVCKMLDTVSGT